MVWWSNVRRVSRFATPFCTIHNGGTSFNLNGCNKFLPRNLCREVTSNNFDANCVEVKICSEKVMVTNFCGWLPLDCYSLLFVIFSESFFRYFSLSLFIADQRVYVTPTASTPIEIYTGILELCLLSEQTANAVIPIRIPAFQTILQINRRTFRRWFFLRKVFSSCWRYLFSSSRRDAFSLDESFIAFACAAIVSSFSDSFLSASTFRLSITSSFSLRAFAFTPQTDGYIFSEM